jgi:hypothetical protein
VTSSSAWAETIVVKSAGPSARTYPPGKSIADNSKLALKAGDSVTILDGRGTRVLKGPGVFATTASTATGSSFSSLLKNTGTRQVRTGAVRGIGGDSSPRPSNVWLIDMSKSGNVCVAGGEGVSAWAPSSQTGRNLTVTRASDGKSAVLALRPYQSIKSWPAELPLVNGAQYKVSGDGLASPSNLKITLLGNDPQGLEDTAAAFIKAGCTAQLDLLVETVSAVAPSDSPSN